MTTTEQALDQADSAILIAFANAVRAEAIAQRKLAVIIEELPDTAPERVHQWTARYHEARTESESASDTRLAFENLAMAAGLSSRRLDAYDAAWNGKVEVVEEMFR